MKKPNLYYWDGEGRRVGPFSREDLRVLNERGLLAPETVVSSGDNTVNETTLSTLVPGHPGRRCSKKGLPSRPRSSLRHPVGSIISAFALSIMSILGTIWIYREFESVTIRGPLAFYVLFPAGLMLATSVLGLVNAVSVVRDRMMRRQSLDLWVTGLIGLSLAILSAVATALFFAGGVAAWMNPATFAPESKANRVAHLQPPARPPGRAPVQVTPHTATR